MKGHRKDVMNWNDSSTYNIHDQRIIWVGVGEQNPQREQHSRDADSRIPGAFGRTFEDIQTDTSLVVNVRMIHFGQELTARWLERVPTFNISQLVGNVVPCIGHGGMQLEWPSVQGLLFRDVNLHLERASGIRCIGWACELCKGDKDGKKTR